MTTKYIGTIDGRPVTVSIEMKKEEKGIVLSISGAIVCGGSGQCADEIRKALLDKSLIITDGMDEETIKRLLDIWDTWHLNDMNAGCQHQRKAKWEDARINPDELPNTHANRDEKGILSIWITPKEHKDGLLTKPCPECGYKYGTAWLYEPLPEDVINFLNEIVSGKISKSAYDLAAEEFLKSHGLEFKATRFIGEYDDNCPPWCEGDHAHGRKYLIMIKKKSTQETFKTTFWGSHDDMEKGKKPSAHDVLSCLGRDAQTPDTFEKFCDEFGYNKDSIKDKKIFKNLRDLAERMEDFFSPKALDEMGRLE